MKKIGQLLMIVGALVLILTSFWLFSQVRTLQSSIGGTSKLVPEITPTIYPSAATVVEQVQTLSRLETASYHIEKVITAESGQGPLGFLFGDKLLLITYGEVIAGMDLGKLGPDDIALTEDGTAYLRLPAAEVFITTLDNNRTYVYDRRTGVAGLNTQLETAARQEAERLILQAALEDGLLEKAEENGRDVMRSLLHGLGFKQVNYVDILPTPTPTSVPTPMLTLTPEN